MATTDKFAIKREIVETYRLGRFGTNDNATASTTTLSDDSQFGGHRGADRIEVGCDVRARQDSTVGGGGTVTFDGSRISIRPTFAAGTLTMDPALALGESQESDQNDTTFYVLYLPFRDEQFDYEIDKVLGEQSMWQKLIRPLTSVADGDMRAAAEAQWTLTNATDAKAAATFPLGERVIVVTASSAGGFTATANIAVAENKSYYLEATGFGTDAADAGTLVLRRITATAADITLPNSVIDRIEPEVLVNNVTMPSGCEQVSIRLTCTNNSDVLSWANVIFRKNEQTTFTLEDKPYRILDIGEVRATNRDNWGTRTFRNMQPVARDVVQLTEGLWQIQLKRSVSGMSVWYEEWVAPGTLSTDASTTIAIKTDVAAVVAERLLRGVPGFEREYAAAAVDAAKVIERAQTQRPYVDTGQRIVTLPRV